MLEYLEKLVAEQKYSEALEYAEQVVSQIDDDPHKLLRLNVALLMSRQLLGEYFGAQAIGQLCIKMSIELQEWDIFAKSCLYLGSAFHCMGQFGEAQETWLDYLSHIQSYTPNPAEEALVRYNMGTTYTQMGRVSDALQAFTTGLNVAHTAGNLRLAHGIRHALINTHIRLGNSSAVPRLLAQSLHYLHHHVEQLNDHDLSRFWHFLIRSEFAISTGRYQRARKVAETGLKESGDRHRVRSSLHMLLARIAEAEGRRQEAVEQAISARMEAIACRRYDLEVEAAEYMYHLLSE